MNLVPADFVPPDPIQTEQFRLALLGPQHNSSDYAAWTSSMDFIRALPGWRTSSWPTPMTLEDNLRDCTSHLARSHSGTDFAYTVLLPDRAEVVGCVYFKPTRPPRPGAVEVRSWVTAEHADLDQPLHAAVTGWVREQWPWSAVEYAAR
ncbi:N-acetyltransferase [Leekyejoonella antrihumi]|uniref:N-acetyltransferase n=1 Tax=Leekyejoonella antrihumi TaxID=1660198 RepID=A0A563E5R5_9MICO|nr:N-acetyltransferase [Leekyejoonella antrihumi]TWP37880.1 N-acetyltransferase [Leekyejoonella antrihumi]